MRGPCSVPPCRRAVPSWACVTPGRNCIHAATHSDVCGHWAGLLRGPPANLSAICLRAYIKTLWRDAAADALVRHASTTVRCSFRATHGADRHSYAIYLSIPSTCLMLSHTPRDTLSDCTSAERSLVHKRLNPYARGDHEQLHGSQIHGNILTVLFTSSACNFRGQQPRLH